MVMHHQSKEEKVKDVFYDNLDDLYEEINSNSVRIIVGDFNTKIRKKEFLRPTIEKHRKLVGWAAGRDCRIVITYYKKKEIYKRTWVEPDNKTVNQIILLYKINMCIL